MGRDKAAQYRKTLSQQAYLKLNQMQAFGESKREAIANGTAQDKIFSFTTYQTYKKHITYFLRYVKKEHPEVTTLKKARRYVNEWLESRVREGLSAWTIQTEQAALNKLYQIAPSDPKRFQAPTRNREDIKRSRGEAARDKHFSKRNNAELINFCKSTGLRRSELQALKGKDLVTREQIENRIKQLEGKTLTPHYEKQLQMLKDTRLFTKGEEYFLYVKGKGGRERLSPICGKDAEAAISRVIFTPKESKVWQYVNSNADIHAYRADYATQIYKNYARDIADIPYDRVNKGTGGKFQGDVYTCRKDEKGKKLDRRAMLAASKALGHNRLEVVANNYIRGL